jgi:hypothetical protein
MKKCCLCNENIEVVRSLCGEVAWTEGHNADPLAEGRCCDTCNWTKVVPARIHAACTEPVLPERLKRRDM